MLHADTAVFSPAYIQTRATNLEYILNFVEAFSGLTGMTEGQLLDWVRSGSGIINIGIIQYNEIYK